jgi:hypothetical protein
LWEKYRGKTPKVVKMNIPRLGKGLGESVLMPSMLFGTPVIKLKVKEHTGHADDGAIRDACGDEMGKEFPVLGNRMTLGSLGWMVGVPGGVAITPCQNTGR